MNLRHLLALCRLLVLLITPAIGAAEPPATTKYDFFTIGGGLNEAFDVPVQSVFQESKGRVQVQLNITSDKMANGDQKERQALAPKLAEFIWKHYDEASRVSKVVVVFQDDARKATADKYTYSPPKK